MAIVTVKYLDKETKVTQLSQFELTLQKNDNWKIIMKEILCKYFYYLT